MIVQTIPSPLPVQHGLSHLLSQPGSPYLIHLSVPVNLVLAHCHQPGPAPMLALSLGLLLVLTVVIRLGINTLWNFLMIPSPILLSCFHGLPWRWLQSSHVLHIEAMRKAVSMDKPQKKPVKCFILPRRLAGGSYRSVQTPIHTCLLQGRVFLYHSWVLKTSPSSFKRCGKGKKF